MLVTETNHFYKKINSESAIVLPRCKNERFKIEWPRWGPEKNCCHKIKVYCIQNDRTDHKKSTEKKKKKKSAKEPRN